MKRGKPIWVGVIAVFWGITAIGYSQIQFEETTHNFGVFEEGKVMAHTFRFKNIGKDTVRLRSVTPSCGCTTPQWTRDPIPPGGTGEIAVQYNSVGRPGQFKKSVTVLHDKSNEPITLYIEGEARSGGESSDPYQQVDGALAFRTRQISAGEIRSDKSETFTFEVKNKSTYPVTFLGAETKPFLTVTFNPTLLYPSQVGQIIVKYDPKSVLKYYDKDGTFYEDIVIKTDDQVAKEKHLYLVGNFKRIYTEQELANAPRIEFDELEFDGGEIIEGTLLQHRFHFRNKGKSNLVIESVKASCGCTATEPEKKILAPGESSYITVTFNSAGKMGLQHKTVTVYTNDPKNPTITLHMRCNVVGDPFKNSSGAPAN
jgi:hypothetical protein